MLLGETHWDGYTIFSVISGILLVLMALFPGEKAGTRVTYFVGGIIMGAYGFYVAAQSSGTYFFSVYIFIVPLLAVAFFIKNLSQLQNRQRPPVASPRQISPTASPRLTHHTRSIETARDGINIASSASNMPHDAEPTEPAKPFPTDMTAILPHTSVRKIVIDLSDLEPD